MSDSELFYKHAGRFEHEQFLPITSITLTQDENGDIHIQSTPDRDQNDHRPQGPRRDR